LTSMTNGMFLFINQFLKKYLGYTAGLGMIDISPTNPRVLIVTPEITYLPKGMGNISNGLNAKAGGLADVSAASINALYSQSTDLNHPDQTKTQAVAATVR